jgi:hypothetical protein
VRPSTQLSRSLKRLSVHNLGLIRAGRAGVRGALHLPFALGCNETRSFSFGTLGAIPAPQSRNQQGSQAKSASQPSRKIRVPKTRILPLQAPNPAAYINNLAQCAQGCKCLIVHARSFKQLLLSRGAAEVSAHGVPVAFGGVDDKNAILVKTCSLER